MGLFDALSKMADKLGAAEQEVQGYKDKYEKMSDGELKREYNRLKDCSGFGAENGHRRTALTAILKERGYIQS